MTRDEAIYFLKQLEELILEQHYAKAKNAVIESFDMAVEALKQTEIIRCKECKRYDGRPCGIVDWYNTADDFCSKAERREE